MLTFPDIKSYDALVVGMGPAGATAAYELSRAGLSVLAIEKHTHPRYKVCGGGLSVRIEQLLDPGFKSVVEHTIFGFQFLYRGQESVSIESPSPIAYMVMRDRFDHHLVQQARRVGTEIHEGEHPRRSVTCRDGVEVTTDRGCYHAKVLIGADGANSQVARHLFPDRRQRCIPTLESEIEIGPGPQYPAIGKAVIDIGACSKGYAWIFPKQGRLSVGVGEFQSKPASLKKPSIDSLGEKKAWRVWMCPSRLAIRYPCLQDRTKSGTGTGRPCEWPSHVGRRCRAPCRSIIRRGYLLCRTFRQDGRDDCPRSAARSDQEFWDYELAIRQELYSEFQIASRLADFIYTFPRLCHRLLGPYQEVVTLYYEVLRGKETYQSFFSQAKGIVKSSPRELLLEAPAAASLHQ